MTNLATDLASRFVGGIGDGLNRLRRGVGVSRRGVIVLEEMTMRAITG